MKKLGYFILLFSLGVVQSNAQKVHSLTAQVSLALNAWHEAAAQAQFDTYFNLMADDAVFIGTDANENWNKTDFKIFAKPYFDKGKAWNFTPIERHIYLDKSGKMAWFDELLHTQMKICRGSGVLVKIGKVWKIQHYVLSMTIPNENVDEVVKIKTPLEDALLEKLTKKR